MPNAQFISHSLLKVFSVVVQKLADIAFDFYITHWRIPYSGLPNNPKFKRRGAKIVVGRPASGSPKY